MAHYWPVRAPRPVTKKLDPSLPFLTGMRILDVLFPWSWVAPPRSPGPSVPARP